MKHKLTKYGVKNQVVRPHIKATKELNLETPEGRELVLSEARNQLRLHQKTFDRLASM
ncbi:acetyltransferase [Aliidiomarina quisquiliarum]|uniref:acetyltransferase n=1 Tax=Aliidiomarina quisquiliarum TaxID=2938947 RepID=UPI00208F6587|nr:acetyltransferase [Aliidiomarina quisquiliarum]MCO4320968.1 acetyltransferase [Aliidiomarina quisquiliarum]